MPPVGRNTTDATGSGAREMREATDKVVFSMAAELPAAAAQQTSKGSRQQPLASTAAAQQTSKGPRQQPLTSATVVKGGKGGKAKTSLQPSASSVPAAPAAAAGAPSQEILAHAALLVATAASRATAKSAGAIAQRPPVMPRGSTAPRPSCSEAVRKRGRHS